jgi:SAM-dependent methyltransferase
MGLTYLFIYLFIYFPTPSKQMVYNKTILKKGDGMPANHESYDEKFFEPLAAIEAKHFWFRTRNHLIGGLIKKFCAAQQSEPGLGMEIGCGTGNVLTFLAKQFPLQHIIGVDLFREGLVVAGRKSAELLVQADIHHAPFSVKFNWIGLFDIIEHLDDDVQVLQQTAALLKPDGFLFISVPAFPVLWSYFDVAGKHKRRYTTQTLQKALFEAGLDLVFSSYTNALLFPPLWLVRRFFQGHQPPESLSEAQLDAKTNEELRIIPVINAWVTLLLGLENRLILAGIHLPFGTSLFAVARIKS